MHYPCCAAQAQYRNEFVRGKDESKPVAADMTLRARSLTQRNRSRPCLPITHERYLYILAGCQTEQDIDEGIIFSNRITVDGRDNVDPGLPNFRT